MKRYLLGLRGEANYQDAIRWIKPGHPVTLAPEPGNRHDPRAIVARNAAGETIGYAPRGGWLTRAMLDEGWTVRARVMSIEGGRPGAPGLGVVLEVYLIESPDEVLPRFAPDPPAAPRERQFAAVPRAGSAVALPAEVPAAKIVRVVAVLAGVALLSLWFGVPGGTSADPARGASEAAPPPMPAYAVQKCRDLLAQATRAGVVRARPEPNRINVDERLWAELPASTKDVLLQAMACDLWQASMPPAGEHVVAYGWRSGKRVQMLTEVGMARE